MGVREKGKLVAQKGKRESSEGQKGEREKAGTLFCDPIPLGNQTARTHERTHARTHARRDTKRFPGWTHSPNLRSNDAPRDIKRWGIEMEDRRWKMEGQVRGGE